MKSFRYRLLYILIIILLHSVIKGTNEDYKELIQPEVMISANAREAFRSHVLEKHTLYDNRPIMEEAQVLEVNLTVQVARFSNSFFSFNTRSYNSMFPSPTIIVVPGETFRIHLHNTLEDSHSNSSSSIPSNITNIHTHGLHVPPTGMADNVLIDILPGGGSHTYEFVIPDSHPAGTFWYHPHHHRAANSQVTGMMAGALIVADPAESLPPEMRDMEDLVLLLQAVCFENCDNKWDNLQEAIENSVYENSSQKFNVDLQYSNLPLKDSSLLHVLVNGQYQPVIKFAPGEIKRLRIINAIANNMVEIILKEDTGGASTGAAAAPSCTMHVIAMDGIYYQKPTLRNLVVIPPGGRADIAVQCNDNISDSSIAIERSDTRTAVLGELTEHRVNSQVIASLVVVQRLEGAANQMSLPEFLPIVKQHDFESANNDNDDEGDIQKYDYKLTTFMTNDGQMKFGINQKVFDPSFVNYTMKVNTVQEWRLSTGMYSNNDHHHQHNNSMKNMSSSSSSSMHHVCENGKSPCFHMNHPFHIHSMHFQIVAIEGVEALSESSLSHGLFSIGEWRDTIPLFRETVIIRFIPPYAGKIMSHCHVIGHADEGMGQMFLAAVETAKV